jgi:hypothetical protein
VFFFSSAKFGQQATGFFYLWTFTHHHPPQSTSAPSFLPHCPHYSHQSVSAFKNSAGSRTHRKKTQNGTCLISNHIWQVHGGAIGDSYPVSSGRGMEKVPNHGPSVVAVRVRHKPYVTAEWFQKVYRLRSLSMGAAETRDGCIFLLLLVWLG